MANLINIRGNSDDPFERYKMPVLQVKTKNKGQYNDNTISGLEAVAKALKVNVECLNRWFGGALKTQGKVQEAGLILKGAFDYVQIEESLRGFIDTYVLCDKCNLPELVYLAKGKKMLISKCQACGHRVKVDSEDKIWKILQRDALVDEANGKKVGLEKKKVGSEKQQVVNKDFNQTIVEDEEVEWLSDLSEAAILKRKDEGSGGILKDLIQ